MLYLLETDGEEENFLEFAKAVKAIIWRRENHLHFVLTEVSSLYHSLGGIRGSNPGFMCQNENSVQLMYIFKTFLSWTTYFQPCMS